MSFRNVDPEVLRVRYGYAPQMRVYDKMEPRVHPYVALSAPRDVRTDAVTTDPEGFRRTPWRCGWTDTATSAPELAGIVLGGSFTFGVGATSDRHTIPAHLARLTGQQWLNLGIRSGNSSQELAAALPLADSARRIIVCSGVNNLVAALQTTQRSGYFAPLFFESACAAVGKVAIHDLVESLERRGPAASLRALTGPRGRAPALSPRPEELTLAQRRDLALSRQVRDLRALGRLAGTERVTFCAQPFADELTRSHPAEQALFRAHDRRQGTRWQQVRTFALACWPDYVARLNGACSEAGIAFLDLPADGFTGWSFVDRVHLTDDGYEQAARLIWENICR
jgi:hypothetical protein